jgi:hypothetical protein
MITLVHERKNVYSQCGEDGILEKIFSTVGTDKGKFVEFGGWDGIKYSNCYNLVKKGWSGLYIEADKSKHDGCVRNMEHYKDVFAHHAPVEISGRNSIDNILGQYDKSTGHPLEFTAENIDVMSIDIDSYDYWVFASLKAYRPKVVIVEALGRCRHIKDIRVKRPDSGMGCSLNAMARLGYYKKYDLITVTSSNVIFIREEDNNINGEKLFKPSTNDDNCIPPLPGDIVDEENVRNLKPEATLRSSFDVPYQKQGPWIIDPPFNWESYE